MKRILLSLILLASTLSAGAAPATKVFTFKNLCFECPASWEVSVDDSAPTRCLATLAGPDDDFLVILLIDAVDPDDLSGVTPEQLDAILANYLTEIGAYLTGIPDVVVQKASDVELTGEDDPYPNAMQYCTGTIEDEELDAILLSYLFEDAFVINTVLMTNSDDALVPLLEQVTDGFSLVE